MMVGGFDEMNLQVGNQNKHSIIIIIELQL
jgi:hypothetical protein